MTEKFNWRPIDEMKRVLSSDERSMVVSRLNASRSWIADYIHGVSMDLRMYITVVALKSYVNSDPLNGTVDCSFRTAASISIHHP